MPDAPDYYSADWHDFDSDDEEVLQMLPWVRRDTSIAMQARRPRFMRYLIDAAQGTCCALSIRIHCLILNSVAVEIPATVLCMFR
jgi:hypothetical protein